MLLTRLPMTPHTRVQARHVTAGDHVSVHGDPGALVLVVDHSDPGWIWLETSGDLYRLCRHEEVTAL